MGLPLFYAKKSEDADNNLRHPKSDIYIIRSGTMVCWFLHCLRQVEVSVVTFDETEY